MVLRKPLILVVKFHVKIGASELNLFTSNLSIAKLVFICFVLVLTVVAVQFRNMPGRHRVFTSKITTSDLQEIDDVDDDGPKTISFSNGLKVAVDCGLCQTPYKGKYDSGLSTGDEVTVKAYVEDWGVYSLHSKDSYILKK